MPRFSVGAKLLGGLGVLAVGAALVVAPHLWTKTTPASGPAAVTSSIIPATPPEPWPGAPTLGEPSPVKPAAPSVPDAPRPSTRSSSARSGSDLLPEEVSLVSRAEQQLYAGHPDDALKTLSEHQRRFPNGALAEQRMAARVQSLCTLGRIAEARADLAGLARAYPRSPQLDRARRFCGIDAP